MTRPHVVRACSCARASSVGGGWRCVRARASCLAQRSWDIGETTLVASGKFDFEAHWRPTTVALPRPAATRQQHRNAYHLLVKNDWGAEATAEIACGPTSDDDDA